MNSATEMELYESSKKVFPVDFTSSKRRMAALLFLFRNNT